jgi:hypothetical protein
MNWLAWLLSKFERKKKISQASAPYHAAQYMEEAVTRCDSPYVSKYPLIYPHSSQLPSSSPPFFSLPLLVRLQGSRHTPLSRLSFSSPWPSSNSSTSLPSSHSQFSMPRLTLVPSMLSAWSVVISDATSAMHTLKSQRSVVTLPRSADLARPVLHRAL